MGVEIRAIICRKEHGRENPRSGMSPLKQALQNALSCRVDTVKQGHQAGLRATWYVFRCDSVAKIMILQNDPCLGTQSIASAAEHLVQSMELIGQPQNEAFDAGTRLTSKKLSSGTKIADLNIGRSILQSE